ncbi:MAG TPA: hypothetical protein VMU41_10490 [Candidatus Binataceae bacterium]|nr:hypothetical protein [Candidatus Binataceae bacterium]
MKKSRLAGIALGFLSCLCALSAEAHTPAPPFDLASAGWSLKREKILNAEPKDAVWKFMNNLWGNNNLGPGNGKLCEFHFADLRHSGELSLVASYDAGGTADCNDVDVFDRTRAGIEDYDFNNDAGTYFGDVENVNGDGNYELVFDKLFVPAVMDHCTATWPVIYAWTGDGYSDVSSLYEDYYRRQLNSPSSLTEADGLDCEKATDAKIRRFLGSRNAGLDDAIRWSESPDPARRKFAAEIFRDIGTPEALEHLRALTNVSNRNVSESARNAVLGIQKPHPYPTAQRELLTPDASTTSAR